MHNKKILVGTIILSTTFFLTACIGGKTDIAVGPPGSATNDLSESILEAYDIGGGDYSEFQERFGDAADEVQDGNIDVSIGVLGTPAGNVENLQASTGDVKLLGLSDEVIDSVEKDTGYESFTISEDTYDFMDDEVETVAGYAVLMGNTNTVDDDLAYNLAKLMIENADENTHAQSDQMTLDHALRGSGVYICKI